MAILISHSAQLVARITASLLGSYAFIWGFFTLGISSLVALGVAYEQAYLTLKLLAFLVFLGLFLWAFVAKSVARLWLVLVGSSALMTAAAWLLQAQLLQKV